MLEAMLAIAIAGLVALGALSVSVALWNQTHRVERLVAARQLAVRTNEMLRARCGVQTGLEPGAVVTAAVTACTAALGAGTSGPAGDTTARLTWRRTIFDVTVRTHWLRRADGVADATTCADLAISPPTALERDLSVSWASPNGSTQTFDATFVEAAPADSPGYEAITSGIMVTGATATDAVELQFVHSVGNRLRRYGTPLAGGSSGCIWFPFLPPGSYSLTKVGGAAAASVVVNAGSVTSVALGSL